MINDPFILALGGEWRREGPTYAQVEAHEGHWWRKEMNFPPKIDSLSACDNCDGRGPFVYSDDDEERHYAESWDDGERHDWATLRSEECAVCPCTKDGVPVPWPTADVNVGAAKDINPP